MKVSIRKIDRRDDEQVIIECVSVTREIEDIRGYAESKGMGLPATDENGRIERLSVEDIYYFEAVDERVFAYTKDGVFEIKHRLYEVESACERYGFMRCSKSVVVNLMKLDGISPALNGRYNARLKNGEKVIISRKYAPDIIQRVTGQ